MRWLSKRDIAFLAAACVAVAGWSWHVGISLLDRMPSRLVTVVLLLLQAAALTLLLVCWYSGRREHAAMGARLAFERRLADVSRHGGAPDRAALRHRLASIVRDLGGHGVVILEHDEARGATIWGTAHTPGYTIEDRLDPATRTALTRAVLNGRIVRLDAASTVDIMATGSWSVIHARGVEALLGVPIGTIDATLGVLLILNGDAGTIWTDEQVDRARTLGQVLAHALRHTSDRRAIDESADLNQAVLSSVGADIAVLDAHGVIVGSSTTWDHGAGERGHPGPQGKQGTRYLAALDLAADAKARLAATVKTVLRGERAHASTDYTWDDVDGRHWSEVRVHRLNRQDGGAVVSHVDITARKRAEAEVHRHLHELAHVNMMYGMGELAAAVSHELNQPLTAVLSNAQAARRILLADRPPLTDVREILDDIIEQDKRAGEVIQRIRRLLKKEQFDWTSLDLNALVRDVMRLLANQAALGDVAIASDLAPDLPGIRGDRVQLQQVVLNLLLNAIQASAATGTDRERRVVIMTRAEREALRLLVRDSGPGILESDVHRIFEPFYTTKPDGLGMGLSISRSIIELHNGQLTAANLTAGGSEFTVLLPLEGTPS